MGVFLKSSSQSSLQSIVVDDISVEGCVCVLLLISEHRRKWLQIYIVSEVVVDQPVLFDVFFPCNIRVTKPGLPQMCLLLALDAY